MIDHDPTSIERRFLEQIESLKRSDAVGLIRERKGYISEVVADSTAGFAQLEELVGISLDPALKDYHVRYSELGINWYEAAAGGAGGEFCLCELVDALLSGPPDDYCVRDDEERNLFKQLRVVDGQPNTGEIAFTAVQLAGNTIAPQMWWYLFPRGAFALDLDYPGYLEALLLTKGFYCWQLLYADVRLGDRGFASTVDSIRNGLDFLKGALPDPRYEELETRLAERLRQTEDIGVQPR
jgi:hypothetical protein